MLADNFNNISKTLPQTVTLVAVSKTYPTENIQALYNLGHKHFGENKVQEIVEKQSLLPKDIQWHFIGHLQTNKVKQIIPFVHLIHSVDSQRLLHKIQTESAKINVKTSVLLQLKIASEDSKFGLEESELEKLLENYRQNNYPNVIIKGLMGMATFTNNTLQVEKEFSKINKQYQKQQKLNNLDTLSIGMSADYQTAIQCGSTMVRIGSSIFGSR